MEMNMGDNGFAELVTIGNSMRNASSLMRQATAKISELETALNRMVHAHENTSADTEGRWPALDGGCIECTGGATPDRFNTGLCAYHNAKKLLGHAS